MHSGLMEEASRSLGDVSVSEVIKELLTAKKAANRREAYVRQLRFFLTMFIRGRENMPIRSLDRRCVAEWLSKRDIEPITRKSEMRRLSVLMSFAVRSGYISTNPVSAMESVTVDLKPPRILTPMEVRKMLNWCRRHLPKRLPQLVLSIYAGIRQIELKRIRWSDLDLERGHVTISAAASKVRQRRIVQLDPKAVAWLRRCKPIPNDKPIGSLSVSWKRLIRKHCGIEWDQNICRHSAASYMLAKHNNAGYVSRMLGNSESVLLTTYFELVHPDDCRRFWYWNPKALKGKPADSSCHP